MLFTKQSIKNSLLRQFSSGFTPTPISRDGYGSINQRNDSNFPRNRNIPKKIGVSLQSKRGFTLIETLVAISILLTAVVAPMVLISGTIGSIFGIKGKITALYLAEDAIDFVKYRIATNFNSPPTSWLNGVIPFPACSYNQPCQVDSFNDTIQDCGGACPRINFDSSTGVYEYILGSPSGFTREVIIDVVTPATNDPYPLQAPQEVIITARVTWQYKGVAREIKITSHVFPWGS